MVLLTLLVYTFNLYLSNKRANTKDCEINDNITYGFVIFGMIIFSFVIDIIARKIELPLALYLITAIVETFYFIYANTKRENIIKKRHEDLKQVLMCLAPIIPPPPKDEELDLEGDYGFELGYDPKTGEINKIECEMRDADKWTDAVLTRIVMNLNKYLSTRRWTNQVDYPNLTCNFVGAKLPPKMAKYPGSWLRPWNFIPIGVDGDNELGINLGAKEKTLGEASFEYEDGTLAKTVLSPKVAQCLVAGATGGGKAIYCEQEVYIKRM